MFTAFAYVLFALMSVGFGYIRSANMVTVMRDDQTHINLRNLHWVASFAGYLGMAAVAVRGDAVAFFGFVLLPQLAALWFFGTKRAVNFPYLAHKHASLASLALSTAATVVCFSGRLAE